MGKRERRKGNEWIGLAKWKFYRKRDSRIKKKETFTLTTVDEVATRGDCPFYLFIQIGVTELKEFDIKNNKLQS